MSRPLIAINMDYEENAQLPRRGKYGLPEAYANCVAQAGGLPLLIPPLEDLALLDDYLGRAAGYVLSGGKDYPPRSYGEENHPKTAEMHARRARADLHIARQALDSAKPVLAICAGIQLINIAAGGKLIQHLDGHRAADGQPEAEHGVETDPHSLLNEIFPSNELLVNSTHHQAVDPQALGRGLRVTARASDGTVEAVELAQPDGRFFLAVQWHPERISDAEHTERIFGAFVQACGVSG